MRSRGIAYRIFLRGAVKPILPGARPITVEAGAIVKGGLTVDTASNAACTSNCTSNGSSSLMTWLFGKGEKAGKPPQIVIGPNAIVEGTLDFRGKVDLEVSDRAKIAL